VGSCRRPELHVAQSRPLLVLACARATDHGCDCISRVDGMDSINTRPGPSPRARSPRYYHHHSHYWFPPRHLRCFFLPLFQAHHARLCTSTARIQVIPHDIARRHSSVTARHYPQWRSLAGAASRATTSRTPSPTSPHPYTHSRNCSSSSSSSNNNNSNSNNSTSRTYSIPALAAATRRTTSISSATTRAASNPVQAALAEA
jgi:hypothetical protein